MRVLFWEKNVKGNTFSCLSKLTTFVLGIDQQLNRNASCVYSYEKKGNSVEKMLEFYQFHVCCDTVLVETCCVSLMAVSTKQG